MVLRLARSVCQLVREMLGRPNTPRHVATSCMLGMALGIVPGNEIAFASMLLAVLIIPCPLGPVLISAAWFWLVRATGLADANLVSRAVVAMSIAAPVFLLSYWIVSRVRELRAMIPGGKQAIPRYLLTQPGFILVRLSLLVALFWICHTHWEHPGGRRPIRRFPVAKDTQPRKEPVPVHTEVNLTNRESHVEPEPANEPKVADQVSTRDLTILDGVSAPLLSAKSVELQWDATALGDNRFVVKDGHVHGVQIVLPPCATTTGIHWENHLTAAIRCQRTLASIATALRTPAATMEIPKNDVAEQLAADELRYWTGKFDGLVTLTQQAERRLAELRSTIQRIGDNPLRDVTDHEQAADEIDGLKETIIELRTETRAAAGHVAQAEARLGQFRDRQQPTATPAITTNRTADALDGNTLAEFLIEPAITGLLNQVLARAGAGVDWMPDTSDDVTLSWEDGACRDLSLADLAGRFRIEQLEFTGDVILGEQALPVTGRIKNLAWPPTPQTPGQVEVYFPAAASPTGEERYHVAQVTLAGIAPLQARVEFTSVETPHAQAELGRKNVIAMTMAPCQAKVRVTLSIADSNIDGQVEITHSGVRLAVASVADATPQDATYRVVQQAAPSVTSIHTKLAINGTIDSPVWSIRESSLSGLAQAINQQVAAKLNKPAAPSAIALEGYPGLSPLPGGSIGTPAVGSVENAGDGHDWQHLAQSIAKLTRQIEKSYQDLTEQRRTLAGYKRTRTEYIGRDLRGGSLRQ